MITAKELRKISEEKTTESVASQNIVFSLGQIERAIKNAASKGETSYRGNVDMMLPGVETSPTAAFRRIICLKLKDLGYSYEENKKGNSIWFTVSW